MSCDPPPFFNLIMSTTPKLPIDLAPTPGFCIKSTVVNPATLFPPPNADSPNVLEPPTPIVVPPGRKVFVNICYDKNVPPPPPADEEVIQRAMNAQEHDEQIYYVPVVVSQPREDKDKGRFSVISWPFPPHLHARPDCAYCGGAHAVSAFILPFALSHPCRCLSISRLCPISHVCLCYDSRFFFSFAPYGAWSSLGISLLPQWLIPSMLSSSTYPMGFFFLTVIAFSTILLSGTSLRLVFCCDGFAEPSSLSAVLSGNSAISRPIWQMSGTQIDW